MFAVIGLLVGPLIWMIAANAAQSIGGYYFIFTGNDDLRTTSEYDAEQIAAFIGRNTKPDDLVVASPQIAWMLPAYGVDYNTLTEYENRTGKALFTHAMFARPVTLSGMAYARLDPCTRVCRACPERHE